MLRLLTDMGIEDVLVLPQQTAGAPAGVGKNTHFICAQPFLGAAYDEMVRRGANAIHARFHLAQMEQLNGWRRLQNVLVLSRTNLMR